MIEPLDEPLVVIALAKGAGYPAGLLHPRDAIVPPALLPHRANDALALVVDVGPVRAPPRRRAGGLEGADARRVSVRMAGARRGDQPRGAQAPQHAAASHPGPVAEEGDPHLALPLGVKRALREDLRYG